MILTPYSIFFYYRGMEGDWVMQGTTPTRLYDSCKLNWQLLVLSVTPGNHKQVQGEEEMKGRKWVEPWEELSHPIQKANQGSLWTYNDLWTSWLTFW